MWPSDDVLYGQDHFYVVKIIVYVNTMEFHVDKITLYVVNMTFSAVEVFLVCLKWCG